MRQGVYTDDNDWIWTVDLEGLKSITIERPCVDPTRVGTTEVIDVPNIGRMNFIIASIELTRPEGQPYEYLMSNGPPLD